MNQEITTTNIEATRTPPIHCEDNDWGKETMVKWSWGVLIATAVISFIPIVGMVMWFLGFVPIVTASVLAIILICKGENRRGLPILLCSLIGGTIVTVVGPMIGAMSLAFFVDDVEEAAIEHPAAIHADAEFVERLGTLN